MSDNIRCDACVGKPTACPECHALARRWQRGRYIALAIGLALSVLFGWLAQQIEREEPLAVFAVTVARGLGLLILGLVLFVHIATGPRDD